MGKIVVGSNSITKEFNINSNEKVVKIVVGNEILTFTPPVGPPPPECNLTAGGNAYGGSFSNATKLAEFTATTDTIKNNQFYNEKQLTCVHMPLMKEISGYNAFSYSTNLQTASLPISKNIGVRSFDNCVKLTSIYAPNCTTVGDYAFEYCAELTNIVLSKLTTVGSNAFNNCKKLTSASIDLSNCTLVGERAFIGCTLLTSIDLPKCTEIKYEAFNACTSLTNVNIPVATTLGGGVFRMIQNKPTTKIRMLATFNTTAQKDSIFTTGWDQITFTWI